MIHGIKKPIRLYKTKLISHLWINSPITQEKLSHFRMLELDHKIQGC